MSTTTGEELSESMTELVCESLYDKCAKTHLYIQLSKISIKVDQS